MASLPDWRVVMDVYRYAGGGESETVTFRVYAVDITGALDQAEKHRQTLMTESTVWHTKIRSIEMDRSD